MITIDELRKLAQQNKTVPAWNGLGIVKLRFAPSNSSTGDKSLAYHFYSARTEAEYHPIHDHVFSFSSKILKGTLQSTFYDFVIVEHETDHALRSSKYHYEGFNNEVVHPNIELYEAYKYNTLAGDDYWLDYRALHKVHPVTPNVVTLINKINQPDQSVVWEQEQFNYIQDKRVPYVNTMFDKMSADECWDIIEDILEN
jgi:hypothetical protein